jgi:hypothetical protein
MTTHHHPVQFEERDGEIVVNVPNVRIKLIRNTKGYNWEISVADDDMDYVLARTYDADAWLRKHYGSE